MPSKKSWEGALKKVEKKIMEAVGSGDPAKATKLRKELESLRAAKKFLGDINSQPAPVKPAQALQGLGTALSQRRHGEADMLDELAQRCKEMVEVRVSKKPHDEGPDAKDAEIQDLRRRLREAEAAARKLQVEVRWLRAGKGALRSVAKGAQEGAPSPSRAALNPIEGADEPPLGPPKRMLLRRNVTGSSRNLLGGF